MVLSNGQFRFVFTARDYPTSVAFYRHSLGLPVDHDWDYGPADKGTVFLAGTGIIEIFVLPPGTDWVKPQGISMLIQVDDADRWLQRAQEHNLKIIQEPVSYPWGHRVLRVEDPDGIIVSLFSLLPAE